MESLSKLKDGSNTVAEYEYDGNNRRTIKKKYVAGTLDETRHFYYSDQWQVLEERVDSSSTADKQYVWGLRYVDDLVLQDKGSTRHYSLQDANFNVVAITNNTGTIKQRFAYQPYDESEELNTNFTPYTGTDYDWNYRFTGRELDLNTGLQLNRNRYYHQQLGRWLSRDPIGYEGSKWNLYEYVNGMATIATDLYGFAPFCCTYITRDEPSGPWTDVKRIDVECPAVFSPSYCCQIRFASKDKKKGRVSGSTGGVCGGGPRTPVPPKNTWCQCINDSTDRELVPPPGGWVIDPKGPNWIGFCFAGCFPCNKERQQPGSSCSRCAENCFDQGKKACGKKKTGTARALCKVAVQKTMEATKIACKQLGK